MTQRRIVILVSMVLMMAMVPFGTIRAQEGEPLPEGTVEATIDGFIDGDKFYVDIGGTVEELNLIGTDAPEPGECYFEEAKAYIERIFETGDIVYLEADQRDRDGRDRILRYVWYLSDDGSSARLLNEKLIRDGYTSHRPDDENTRYEHRLDEAQTYAQEQDRGIWRQCGGEHVALEDVENTIPPDTQPAYFEIASAELQQVARLRWRIEIVIPEGSDHAIVAACAEAVRMYLGREGALVVTVFGVQSFEEVGGGFTRCRAVGTTDGLGHSGDGNTLLGTRDDGRIQVELGSTYAFDDIRLFYVE